ncbi:hypothetical protein CkaCkLH20_02047 [Colletotrichum karsti]|uniref:DUF676 domain-containing protein n=1 Tax=Colletotrichum karsti TaxID=1095194 RepID=A0A9P6LNM7_9PEZI|nr:uncharacterized protein CkaCkLH20_02047 [Colletotrichum karsti]KAF9880093.1 hypothetical protein CkaCkLH20_02047 [Colletotrichum karsti]
MAQSPVNVYHSLPRDLSNQKIVASSVRPVTTADLRSLLRKEGPVRPIRDRPAKLELRKPDYYTGSPWKLAKDDAILFFKNILYLPGIVFPLWSRPPQRSFDIDSRAGDQSGFIIARLRRQFEVYAQQYFHSGPLDELYPSFANFYDVTFHFILIIAQSAFLLSIPFLSFFSFNLVVAYIIGFTVLNYVVCYGLNGYLPDGYIQSTDFPEASLWDEQHKKEQWIFLNGVAVGQHWLRSNIDRISLTFHRRVIGVHNKTNGIIFDIIQCLLERCLYFGTSDTRACFALISEALLRPNNEKVVLILHSQGGLEGSIILDWLINQHPRSDLQKLEIYTFGNAANHFNNPRIFKDAEPGQEPGTNRAIRHIEHYANSSDFVSRWGVMNFKKKTADQQDRSVIYNLNASVLSGRTEPKKQLSRRQINENNKLQEAWNSYAGALFERTGSGHQFNQHYLDNMFPLDKGLSRVQQNGDGSPLPGTFMAAEVNVFNDPKQIDRLRNLHNGHHDHHGGHHHHHGINGDVTIKKVYQLSRLWEYVNGNSPRDEYATEY